MSEENSSEIMETDSDKISIAKGLFNSGSRNYMVKQYDVAADELSQVCTIYEELNGPLCDELGMPYLLYAKCLIILAVEENKVLDVPNEDISEDDEEDEESEDIKSENVTENNTTAEEKKIENLSGNDNEKADTSIINAASPATDCVPGTSKDNKEIVDKDEIEETDAASNLQIAWEILELAAKIFSKQGMGALPNLAEVHTELGNIEFENNVLEDARNDYEKSLCIYKELPIKLYRRAIAEVNYKIGLTYLLQDAAPEGIISFKTACDILNDEIEELRSKENVSQKDKENIQDMEETQQEILDKITEIEETRKQSMEKVREAIHNFILPVHTSPEKQNSTASNISEKVTKPNDISHLIKRKKPSETSPTEGSSPAKRPAL